LGQLKQKIESLSDTELLEMVKDNIDNHTTEASIIAKNEIIRRQLQKEPNKDGTKNKEDEECEPDSGVAVIITFLGWAILGIGVVVGIGSVGILGAFYALLSGSFFVGMGEIIKLLYSINFKLGNRK